MNEQALDTLRSLCRLGYAGLDQYDDTRFVIDCPEPFLTSGEDALDDLGAYFLQVGPHGTRQYVAAILPSRVTVALGLDESGAPRLVVPLASRRSESGLRRLGRMIDDVIRTGSPA